MNHREPKQYTGTKWRLEKTTPNEQMTTKTPKKWLNTFWSFLFESGGGGVGWQGFCMSVPHFLTNCACLQHRTKCQCLLVFDTLFHLAGDWEPCGHLAEDGCSGEDGERNGLIKSHSPRVPGGSGLPSSFSPLFHTSLFSVSVYIIAQHLVGVFVWVGFIFNYLTIFHYLAFVWSQ